MQTSEHCDDVATDIVSCVNAESHDSPAETRPTPAAGNREEPRQPDVNSADKSSQSTDATSVAVEEMCPESRDFKSNLNNGKC